jgi:hypothetical protein
VLLGVLLGVCGWFVFGVGNLRLVEEGEVEVNSFSSCYFEREWRLAFLGLGFLALRVGSFCLVEEQLVG